MVSRYDKLIETAAINTKLKFSVAKAFVEVVSNYNPFLYEVDKKAWPELVKHKEDWKRLFLSHFVQTLGAQFQPDDSELQNLYCAYYGLTKLRYDKIFFNLGFDQHPMVLLMDPAKNLFLGFSYLAKLIEQFPGFSPPMAWKLAVVAYFTDSVRAVEVAHRMRNTLSDQCNKQATLDRELRHEFHGGADVLIALTTQFGALRDEYLKQELTLMGM